MIDKDDCISITDRTFDLSLDDPLSDTSSTAVDSLTDNCHTNVGGPPHKNRLQSILTEDVTNSGKDKSSTTRFTDAQPRWGAPDKVHTPIKQANRTTTSIKTSSTVPDIHLQAHNNELLIDRLKTAIRTLINISGNTVESTPENMDMDSLVEMVSKLTESSDYKMRFLTKNYSFLESMYDATRRELDSTRAELHRSTERIRLLEEELHEQEEQQHALKQQLQVKEDSQRGMLGQDMPHNYNTNMQEAKSIIYKQQREIKEYKIFIKQMMDRE